MAGINSRHNCVLFKYKILSSISGQFRNAMVILTYYKSEKDMYHASRKHEYTCIFVISFARSMPKCVLRSSASLATGKAWKQIR